MLFGFLLFFAPNCSPPKKHALRCGPPAQAEMVSSWGGKLTQQLMVKEFKTIKVNGMQANVCKLVRLHCDSKDLFRQKDPYSVFR